MGLPHRVLRSSGTDRHYSISNARKLKRKAINAVKKRTIKLEEIRAQATNSSSEDDDVIQDVFLDSNIVSRGLREATQQQISRQPESTSTQLRVSGPEVQLSPLLLTHGAAGAESASASVVPAQQVQHQPPEQPPPGAQAPGNLGDQQPGAAAAAPVQQQPENAAPPVQGQVEPKII